MEPVGDARYLRKYAQFVWHCWSSFSWPVSRTPVQTGRKVGCRAAAGRLCSCRGRRFGIGQASRSCEQGSPRCLRACQILESVHCTHLFGQTQQKERRPSAVASWPYWGARHPSPRHDRAVQHFSPRTICSRSPSRGSRGLLATRPSNLTAARPCKQLTSTPRRDDPLPTGRENYASRSRTRWRVLSTSQPLPLPAGSRCDAPRTPTAVRLTVTTAVPPGRATSKSSRYPSPRRPAQNTSSHTRIACTQKGRPSAVTSRPYRGACHPSPGHDRAVQLLSEERAACAHDVHKQ